MAGAAHGRPKADVEEDLDFQRRQWRVQVIARWAMVVLVVAALLGVFGDGPLGTTRAGDPQVLAVEYPRLLRRHAPAQIEIDLGPAAVDGGRAEVTVSTQWAADAGVRRVVPEPEVTSVEGGVTRYALAVPRKGSGLRVVLEIEPEKIGRVTGYLGVEGRPRVPLAHFVYP